MAFFLHEFNTVSEYDDKRKNNYFEPWVSYTIENGDVEYNKTEEEKLLEMPLTFEIMIPEGTGTGSIYWQPGWDWGEGDPEKTIEYSRDGGQTWIQISTSDNDGDGAEIEVADGDTLMFRGDYDSYGLGPGTGVSPDYAAQFGSSNCMITVKGNIMSLINSTGFTNLKEFPAGSYRNFIQLLAAQIVDASELMLPVTALTRSCYQRLFYWSYLVTPPKLPATVLASNCYNGMFSVCTGLTTAPELPATTLADNCYNGMFYCCTGLTTAPELPATTLAEYCYADMFRGCSGLTVAPSLPATTLAGDCYRYMFQDCTSLTTAPELPATTLAVRCYTGMFNGCTSLTAAPALPATTLTGNCYDSMFGYCTGLTTAPDLPATTLAGYCYQSMFRGCTSLTTAPELPATTLATNCYQYMFSGCTNLVSAPELPATTLVQNCYYQMFYGCTNLNYVKAMFTTTPGSSYTSNWLSGVASSGTFVKNSAAAWNVSGVNGIPNGWTVQTETPSS